MGRDALSNKTEEYIPYDYDWLWIPANGGPIVPLGRVTEAGAQLIIDGWKKELDKYSKL